MSIEIMPGGSKKVITLTKLYFQKVSKLIKFFNHFETLSKQKFFLNMAKIFDNKIKSSLI